MNSCEYGNTDHLFLGNKVPEVTKSLKIHKASKDAPDTITLYKKDLAALLTIVQSAVLEDRRNFHYAGCWYNQLDSLIPDPDHPKSLHVHEPLEDLQIVSDAYEGFLYVYLKGKLIHSFMIGDWL